jgi:hypothetical protein
MVLPKSMIAKAFAKVKNYFWGSERSLMYCTLNIDYTGPFYVCHTGIIFGYPPQAGRRDPLKQAIGVGTKKILPERAGFNFLW